MDFFLFSPGIILTSKTDRMNYFTMLFALLFGVKSYSQSEIKAADRFQWSFEGQFVAAIREPAEYTPDYSNSRNWSSIVSAQE